MSKFIVLEGTDFSGKGTIASLLEDYFKQKEIQYIRTREPGGTGCQTAEKMRSLFIEEDLDPLAETLLLLAARQEHVVKTINPALKEGKVVLCERFIMSTYVYQCCGKNVDLDLVRSITDRYLLMPICDPHYIVLDINYETFLSRLNNSNRQLDRFESLTEEAFNKRRKNYSVVSLVSSDHCDIRIFDANKTIEEVFIDVKKHVTKLMEGNS